MRVCMCVCARPRALTGCCHHQLQGSESLHKRKSVWTQEEDALLRDAYMRVSAEYEDPIPWLHVAQLVPTRTSKQVCVCVPCHVRSVVAEHTLRRAFLALRMFETLHDTFLDAVS